MPDHTPDPLQIDPKYLESAQVQLNVRIPLRLRAELDKYLDYMKSPEHRRPPETTYWPSSSTAVVAEALQQFLDNHAQKKRTGPNAPPAVVQKPQAKINRTAKKAIPKSKTRKERHDAGRSQSQPIDG